MAIQQTARGFRYPSEDRADVPDIPLHFKMLAEDSDAMYAKGTLAARPAFGKVGREYYATDTGDVWMDIGTAWILKGGSNVLRKVDVPRIVRGSVSTGGVKVYGTEFTSVRNSVGSYTIQYDPDFPAIGDPPIVIAIDTLNSAGSISLDGVGTNEYFSVKTYNSADALADRSFNFIAIGARS